MLKPVSGVAGAIHDVARLKEMDLEPCYVIAISQPTLNIIQNYAIDEITFLSRFGVVFDGKYYTPVDESHADYDFVQDTIRRYRLEVIDLTGDLISAIDNLAACCAAQGASSTQDIDSTPHDGVVTFGSAGDQFETQDDYLDAKCNAANAIFDTIKDFLVKLGEDLDTIKLGIGLTSGLLALAGIAGPVSWAVVGVAGVLVGMAYHLLTYSIDFGDVETALDDVHSEIVIAIYNASDALTAKASFLSALSASTPSLTTAETAIVSMMLTAKLLNQLFEPRGDVAVYSSPDPILCDSAGKLIILPAFHGGPPGGEIVGSSELDIVTDTVVVDAVLNSAAGDSYLVYAQRVTGGIPDPALISADMTVWADYCAKSSEASAYYIQPGYSVQQSFLCSLSPEDLVGINADTWILRSNGAFTVTFEME